MKRSIGSARSRARSRAWSRAGTWARGFAPAAALVGALAAAPGASSAQAALRLGDVVASALATHPALDAGRARAATAESAAGEARAERWPSLGALALASHYERPMVVAPLHGFDPQNPPSFDRTLLQGHASMDWMLFDGGARRARIRGADHMADAASAGAAAAADAVVAEAVSSYLAALTARSLLGAHERQVEALESERARAARMFDEGRAPRVHVLRTEAALSRAQAERAAAAERLRLALRRLARVSGLDASRVESSALPDVVASPLPPGERDALLASARSSNPLLAQASARAAAAAVTVSAARSLRLPRLSVAGRYSAFGSTNTAFEPEWSVGAQVSYPVFGGGARTRAIDRAAADAAAARADLAQATRAVEDAVDAALMAYRSASERTRALEAAVARSAEVARIEALALEAGAGVQTDFLRAEADLLSARAALAEARHLTVEARVGLARATGLLTADRLTDLVLEVER